MLKCTWQLIKVFHLLSVLAIGLWLGVTPVLAQDYQTAPPAPWVSLSTFKTTSPSATGTVADGIDYLLADTQVRVQGNTQARYMRFARRAVNTDGVERISNISLSFDPIYQRLKLHGVVLHRSGRTINVLKNATIRVLQRETELEYQIYDGSKTLNIIIPDVRVGDIIEYHFTREGINPVFAGSFQDFIELQWSVPIAQVQYRLLWPSDRKLHIKKHGIEMPAIVNEHGGMTEYRWARQDVPAVSVDQGLPSWYDPYPWIQLSESSDWIEVVRWARDLFGEGDQTSSPALRAAANQLTSATTPEQRVLDILRYVQDDIRYLGIEMGERSHAPSHPDEVMQRRFGDCKDKTRLMVGLLRASNIEAWPALVNTGILRGLSDYHPAKTLFNHAIVYVRVNGKSYWLDPTLKYQKGTLDTLFQPNYEKALVVAKQTTSLTDMKDATEPHEKLVQEIIDLRGPRDQPVPFTVTSFYKRYYADGMRQTLATKSHDELQKAFTNYYVKEYPGTQNLKPFEVVDDSRLNLLTMTEYYTVRDVWVKRAENKRVSVAFYPYLLIDIIKKPASSLRSMPLHVSYPVRFQHTTIVQLPGNWDIKNSVEAVHDGAFDFKRRITYHNNTLTLDYEYTSLRDSVAADDAKGYAANISRALDMLGYEIYQPSEESTAQSKAKGNDMNWPILAMFMMATMIWIFVAWLAFRYDPPYTPRHPIDSSLTGIGGWLVLPAIGLVVSPLVIFFGQRDMLFIFSAQAWAHAVAADGANPFLGLMIILELTFNIGLIIFGIVLAILFFQKRHTLPRLYIIYAVTAAVIMTGDMIVAPQVLGNLEPMSSKDVADVVRNALNTIVWVWYFLVSKRVRATFIMRRKTD